MYSSREGKGANSGSEVIRYKVEGKKVRTGIELGGLESRGERQSRPLGNLAGTSAWNSNSGTRYSFARDEIIKTGLS